MHAFICCRADIRVLLSFMLPDISIFTDIRALCDGKGEVRLRKPLVLVIIATRLQHFWDNFAAEIKTKRLWKKNIIIISVYGQS